MIKKILCAGYLFAKNLFHRRLDPEIWNDRFDGAMRAKYAYECKVAWLLVGAVRLKDPYMVARAFNAMRDRGLPFDHLGLDLVIPVLESLAWVKDPDFKSIEREFQLSKDIDERYVRLCGHIAVWRVTSELPAQSSLDLSDEPVHGMGWLLPLLKGAVLENGGEFDRAEQSYRKALNLMPNWMPESRMIYHKLNYLINR